MLKCWLPAYLAYVPAALAVFRFHPDCKTVDERSLVLRGIVGVCLTGDVALGRHPALRDQGSARHKCVLSFGEQASAIRQTI